MLDPDVAVIVDHDFRKLGRVKLFFQWRECLEEHAYRLSFERAQF